MEKQTNKTNPQKAFCAKVKFPLLFGTTGSPKREQRSRVCWGWNSSRASPCCLPAGKGHRQLGQRTRAKSLPGWFLILPFSGSGDLSQPRL